ncbi:hypothetical protein N7490_008324 [Penicillium lividum]|nr:hypothetical protein N7490_008324 [Penicillium lividum]
MPDGSTFCLHTDVAAARDTLARIRVMETELGVHITLAHDATWMEEGKNAVTLLSLLDDKSCEDVRHSLRQQLPL